MEANQQRISWYFGVKGNRAPGPNYPYRRAGSFRNSTNGAKPNKKNSSTPRKASQAQQRRWLLVWIYKN